MAEAERCPGMPEVLCSLGMAEAEHCLAFGARTFDCLGTAGVGGGVVPSGERSPASVRHFRGEGSDAAAAADADADAGGQRCCRGGAERRGESVAEWKGLRGCGSDPRVSSR